MSTLCPSCGATNIPGSERCEECLHSLMERDLRSLKKESHSGLPFMKEPVSHLLTGKDLLIAKSTDSVEKIVKTLQKKEKHCVLIYEKTKLVGILSSRDLLFKVAGKYFDLSKIPVSEVMTSQPEFLRAEDPLAQALNKMSLGGFRQLPVLDQNGKPISIITIKDVLNLLTEKLQAAT